MTDSSDDIEVHEFRAFLETIVPAEFDCTSALLVTQVDYATSGFEEFVNQKIELAERIFRDQNGEVDPLLWLATAREERMFEAYHDETNRDMFERMQREARSMSATMVFVAMILHAANEPLDINGLDADEVRAAIDRGDLLRHYGWYAEHRPLGGEPDRRGGVWEIPTDGTRLGPRTDGMPVVAPLFHAVLSAQHGHSDQR